MVNKLRALCEKKSNTSKKHTSAKLFDSKVDSETGKVTIYTFLRSQFQVLSPQ